MKRIVAVILIILIVAPPASAGQQLGAWMDWNRVKSLKAGTEIMVLSGADSAPTKVKLLFADDSIVVTLKPDAPKLPGKVRSVLLEVSYNWPVILNRAGSFAREQVRISAEGVFDRDQKVAELAAVVQQLPRTEIRGITDVPHSHLARNILIGVAVGVGAFFALLAVTLSGT